MKILLVLCITQLLIITFLLFKPSKFVASNPYMHDKNLLNMANTVSPVISQIAQTLGGYKRVQSGSGVAKGGELIYKREIVVPKDGFSCGGDGVGNIYYIRCYEWGYEGGRLWRKPTHDVPIGSYSCIPEKDVLIPYFDKKLQNAIIGEKYYY